MEQQIITNAKNYIGLDNWISKLSIKKILVVCGSSVYNHKKLVAYLDSLEARGITICKFSNFQPNPVYESVVEGVELFRKAECEAIIAIGGGSAIDVAKCIKLFFNMNPVKNYLEQAIIPNDIPFMAIPTTAGTGSEATKYAVIYLDGVKKSVTDDSCIPEIVLMDSSLLETLPLYQKKATMMDALSHAIESYWSINSTKESRKYSKESIDLIVKNMDGYLNNTSVGNEQMLKAANIAGKAINITQTTAGHAMCYKITSLFGISHGHAAIICNRVLYKWMLNNLDKCFDSRGKEYLENILDEIGIALGARDAYTGAEKLSNIYYSVGLDVPSADDAQIRELKESVNQDRLKNFPIRLDEGAIKTLYAEILR